MNEKNIHEYKSTKKVSKVFALCISHSNFSLLTIEVDISSGLFQFNIVGIPDKITKESPYRIISALRNTKFITPTKNNEKVTVSLSPIDIPKKSIGTDLAITFAYLIASNQISASTSPKVKVCCIGDITLTGDIDMQQKDISHLIFQAYQLGITHFIVPASCHIELRNSLITTDIHICHINDIGELRENLIFKTLAEKTGAEKKNTEHSYMEDDDESNLTHSFQVDLLDGLNIQKRVLQIAIAGDHHVLFVGPPGSGKSALAKSALQLQDRLTPGEYLELQAIRHISNTFLHQEISDSKSKLNRPVEIPHYKITPYQLIGNRQRPVGLVHETKYGILILDEFAEYDRQSIESLRHRLDTNIKHFSGLIIATSNLCPCGKQSKEKTINSQDGCTCTIPQIKKYISKISEPMQDRFQIICHLNYTDHTPQRSEKINTSLHLTGPILHQKIKVCRAIQRKRNKGIYNGQLSIPEIINHGISREALTLVNQLKKTLAISKRKFEHMFRVARTIADLESQTMIETKHIYEAVQYVKQRLS